MKNLVRIIALSMIISSCTNVAIPIATETPDPTLTPSPTTTITPTSTQVPIALLEASKRVYLAMVLIQTDGNLIAEFASRVQSGELEGFEQFAPMLTIAALIKGVDESLPEIESPQYLRTDWEGMVEIHNSSKELYAKWINKEISTSEILDQIEPINNSTEKIMQEVDKNMSDYYAFSEIELNDARSEILESVSDIFESTSTPEP